VVSLSGLRLAFFAAFVALVTQWLYRPRPDQPPAPELYKGAMAAAVILAVLALFNSPGFFGGTIAVAALLAASNFLLSR
jgi:hypothetical protein